uniref:Transposase n=1 Tax=Chenopodium quinoa TaxID=63459 RepID=A0A803N597_CHEQI
MDSGTKVRWMFAKWSDEYERGVDEYVQKAFASKSQGNQICCPCESCHYRFWCHEGVVRDQLICNGFVPRTVKLSELGISIEREQTILDNDEGSNPNDFNDDIVGLLHDARDDFRKGPNDEAKKFFKLVEEGQEELYLSYISQKNKDNVSARQDLVELNLMPELQPIEFKDGSEEFPRSRFWMSLEQKHKFCQVIKNAKLPQGYASNLSRCVQVRERKIAGYKSHDAHFMMNYLLPIVVKTTLPKDVASPLIRLCAFFKGIWSKTIDPRDLGKLQSEIVKTLCLLERIFPPAFFDIMEHLPIHLVDQINEQKICVSAKRKRKWNSAEDHSKDFMDWFREKVDLILKEGHDNIPDHILWLSKGPSHIAKKYTGYSVNGYRFHTMKRDANCITQNSGVTLIAITHSFASSKDQNPVLGNVNYYGSITEIIEISYHVHFSVVLFRCQWFHSIKDDDELITVNMNKTVSKEEPFILATQAHQVFYVEDLNRDGWHYAIQIPPRELSDGNRHEVVVSQSQVLEYELQRLQKLKSNAEQMKAQGSGSLANKIL